MRDLIHFAHGNGFPSLCYTQLLNGLRSRFDCCYIEKIGHNEQFPITENWDYLADEIISSVKTQATQPVIAVGHSLGGILSLLAAIEQPELFKAVILLDSPVLGRIKSGIVHFSKMMGVIDHLTPAFRTRGRRVHWKTREEVLAYLEQRTLFRYFTKACLNDYIDYGLKKDKSGYTLRFNPDIEYRIYRTIPHVLHHYVGKLKVPTVLIYGNSSSVVDRLDLHYMKNKYGIATVETGGTHMFPMEYPEDVAKLITRILDDVLTPKLHPAS
jgi:pimeloyl-ACP methyl ester carboxylesterase